MTDLVDITLRKWRQTPFQWGLTDCMLSIADYVFEATGDDWGKRFRGTYKTERGAFRHILKAGGEFKLIDASGLASVEVPERGDIVLAGANEFVVAGICTGDGVAMRLLAGVIEMNLDFIIVAHAWKVPLCPLSSELARPLLPVYHQQ